VKCSDCHDIHGTFGPNNLKSAADQSAICTKCHMDVRGPFVYEHAPVKAEGCLGCHSPHGSQNARMLNMPSINTLCNQCHSRVANATIHGMGADRTNCRPAQPATPISMARTSMWRFSDRHDGAAPSGVIGRRGSSQLRTRVPILRLASFIE